MNTFNDYIAEKLLNLGFIIYGGYVRDKFSNIIKRSDFIKAKNCISDIDCICTICQFNELTCFDMKKYSDLSFSFKKVTCDFLNTIELDSEFVSYYSGYVINKINKAERMYIDVLVCHNQYLSLLLSALNKSIDFLCNKLCMQKNITVSYSLLDSIDNTKLFVNVINQIDNLIAHKNAQLLSFSRIHKMITYGYKVDIGYNVDNNISYLFLSKINICQICNELTDKYIMIQLDNKIMHFCCYINKSIDLCNILYNKQITRQTFLNQSEEPDIIEVKDNSNVEPELIEFIKFTKSKETNYNTSTEEPLMSIVDNTIFMNGIAMDPTFYDLIINSQNELIQNAELLYLCKSEKNLKYLIELEFKLGISI